MSNDISNKKILDGLIKKIVKNSDDDRKLADNFINTIVDELATTNNPVTIGGQSIQKFMEIKTKSNDILVKLVTSIQKREQSDQEKKVVLGDSDELSEEELSSYVNNLYTKFSDSTVKSKESDENTENNLE